MLESVRRCSAAVLFSAIPLSASAGGLAAAEVKAEAEWLQDGSIGRSIPILADPGGLRSALWSKGVKIQLNDIAEIIGNPGGGLQRGVRPGNRLEFVIDADLEKSFGWSNTSFHANAFFIGGTGLSRYDIGNLMPVSNIEALPSARLSELWIEHGFADTKASLRIGQLAADTEFMTSSYAGLFISGTFGWPTLFAADMPSGGPAYPFATPGARLSYAPNDNAKLLLGVFNGDPAGPGAGDPQQRNRNGLAFRLQDAPLVIGEAQYSYGDEKSPDGLSGTAKIGAWGHFGRFDSQQFGPAAALPASVTPLSYRGDAGIYGLVDQQVLRLPDDPKKGIGVFLRAAVSPTDRNLVDVYLDGGVNFSGMISARADDSFGFAVGMTHISSYARRADIAGVAQGLRAYARGGSEALFEATYSAQIMEGWTLQPLIQYIVNPNGGVDATGARRIGNATVVGLRTTVRY